MAQPMFPVTRYYDCCTGHDACPPIPLMTSSEDVIVNNRGCGRRDDLYYLHGCPAHAPHSDIIVGGSKTVFVNGRPMARITDPVVIGGSVMEGSENVFCGD